MHIGIEVNLACAQIHNQTKRRGRHKNIKRRRFMKMFAKLSNGWNVYILIINVQSRFVQR